MLIYVNMEEIKKCFVEVVKKLYGLEDVAIVFEAVPVGVEADYATNVAMRLAKTLKKSPRDVAEEVVADIRHIGGNRGWVCEVAGPGFINVTLDAKYLWHILDKSWSENYGSCDVGRGKKAIVEFPSQNMAKPYSVGHLRPGTQGWAVKNLLEKTGWEVITDNHLGDAGTPFGIWAVGFLDSGKNLDTVTVYDLGQIYIDMKKRLKDEAEAGKTELKDAVQDWLLKLEHKDEEALMLSRRFNEISLGHIHEVMGRLGLKTDYELGESFYVERGKKLVKDYVAAGLFECNEDGSVICRLDEFGIDVPLLVQKSNGAALYATTDLATMVYRAEEWSPDLVVYCVGAEQKFYFEQLFAMGKKLKVPQNNVHLWFGTIDQIVEGKREKMSSRKGVILMEELLDKAEERARSLTAGREVSDEDIRKVAVGAVKFTDFVADKKTGILFDWDKIFALTGFSGPFCQYAAVRAEKILTKNADLGMVEYVDYDWRSEKGLLKTLLDYPNVVKLAAERLEAHRIAAYVFSLAQEFNRYYEATPVTRAGEIERTARIMLLSKVSYVLKDGLGLLGVEVPTRM